MQLGPGTIRARLARGKACARHGSEGPRVLPDESWQTPITRIGGRRHPSRVSRLLARLTAGQL
jgi:hypothetical protein